MNIVQNKMFIMNYNNENIGYVERTNKEFIQCLGGKLEAFELLPPIMSGIAPEPTQFPMAGEVLKHYDMDKLDVWTYLARSNGIKTSRDVWFMAEPTGEVWVPLVVGMQRKSKYDALFQVGDAVNVLMSGKAYVNRHTIDIFPPCIQPYLKRDGETRFSTTTGYVRELVPYPSIRGHIGIIVLNFA